jgi:hypothetical protein
LQPQQQRDTVDAIERQRFRERAWSAFSLPERRCGLSQQS